MTTNDRKGRHGAATPYAPAYRPQPSEEGTTIIMSHQIPVRSGSGEDAQATPLAGDTTQPAPGSATCPPWCSLADEDHDWIEGVAAVDRHVASRFHHRLFGDDVSIDCIEYLDADGATRYDGPPTISVQVSNDELTAPEATELARAVTAAGEYLRHLTMSCPDWCAGDPNTHPEEDGYVHHQRSIGSLGVSIDWFPHPELDPSPLIYVPKPDCDGLMATPSFARQLGADLIAAAAVLDARPSNGLLALGLYPRLGDEPDSELVDLLAAGCDIGIDRRRIYAAGIAALRAGVEAVTA